MAELDVAWRRSVKKMKIKAEVPGNMRRIVKAVINDPAIQDGTIESSR